MMGDRGGDGLKAIVVVVARSLLSLREGARALYNGERGVLLSLFEPPWCRVK